MSRLRSRVECFPAKLPTDLEPLAWNLLLGFVILMALTAVLRFA